MKRGIYFFAAFGLFCLIFGNLVLGDVGVTITSGVSTNVNVSSQVSINVNNSNFGDGSNISKVDVTLPGGIVFVSGTGSSSVSGATFSNTSNVLTWNSSLGALIGNGSSENFLFNINASSFGSWNIGIKTYNGSGTYDSNLTINVTDNLSPTISLVNPLSMDGTNSTRRYIELNATASDNGVLGTLVFRLYDSSYNLINSTSFISRPYYVNWSLPSEGLYYYNVTANDSYGNLAYSVTRAYRYDISAPSLSLSRTKHGEDVLGISIGTGEDLNGACSSSRGDVGGTGKNQYINLTGLDCGTYYVFNVSCADFSGNIGRAWVNYSTDDCVNEVTSSNSDTNTNEASTSESQTDYWTNTYSYDTKDLSEQPLMDRDLRAKERIKLEIKNDIHYVGVIQLTQVSATINVSSNSQQAIFAIGEAKKFELNEDGYYDLLIALNDIKDNMASLNVSYIHEKIGASGAGSQSSEDLIGAGLGELGKLSLATWVVLLAIVIGAVVAGYFGWKRYGERKITRGVRVFG